MADDAGSSDIAFGEGVLGTVVPALVAAAASGNNISTPIDADGGVVLPDEMISKLYAGGFHIV